MRYHLYLLVSVGVAAAACSDPLSPAFRALDAAEAKWADAGYASYEFTTLRACECPPELSVPMRVTVTNGVVTAVTRISDAQSVDPSQWYTIEDLFAVIRIELDRLPSRVEVDYDATIGFPEHLIYGRREVDDGAEIEVSGVVESAPARGATRARHRE
ncbi:MAG TPA: DUF6174 domain-containing protein [Gemmatimonadaceae bacterium]|nr:DUF6174 domain-containing protein [Gemmatimonadaceae bacterium]